MLIQEMKVFKKSHQLTLQIYKITRKFPGEEKFSMVQQIRRAMYSVPMNLAEGSAKGTKNELIYHINIAIGSITEVNYQIMLSKDLKYLSEFDFNGLNSESIEIKKMLLGLRKSLKKR